MFGKSKTVSKDLNKHNSTTLISPATTITGDVHFTGTVHIEGCIKGNISSEKGLLTIASNGSVEGDVHVQRVVIDGNVCGNVCVEEHLTLASKAVITGNVFYNVIEMAKGSQVNGSLEHHSSGLSAEQRPLLERSGEETVLDGVVEAVDS